MSTPLFVNSTITINAAATKVWDALTNPQQTKKYMFGCEATSDYKVGSRLTWEGIYDGKLFVAVVGHIVAIEPGKQLVYTTFDPNNPTLEDIPSNYLTVTYTLTEENGHTRLDVTQGDFATVADSEKRYNDAYNNGEGWNPILVQIKELVESE